MTQTLQPSRSDHPLVAEQRRDWLAGRRTRVEEYLERQRDVRLPKEVVQDLVYQEYCLRRETGERPSADEYLQRFAEHHHDLVKLFAVDGAVADDTVAEHGIGDHDLSTPTEAQPADDRRQLDVPLHVPSRLTPMASRNLLFALLALQRRALDRASLLSAFRSTVESPQRSLEDLLRERNVLSVGQVELLNALVEHQLWLHHGNALAAWSALPCCDVAAEDARRDIDPDIQDDVRQLRAMAGVDERAALYSDTVASARRFKKLRFHAKGGLGEVHLAEDRELRREVALKEIQVRHADNPDNQERFRFEAEVTGGLEHPGIVPVYALGAYADGRPFYAMRFIKGDSLQDAIRDFHAQQTDDPIKFRQLLRRFSDVCNAMQYAHDRGVLHRDLKPGNIMLGKYGETMVVDWGLAKTSGDRDAPSESEERPLRPLTGDYSAPTEQGSIKGTLAYMSPEQAKGEIDRLGPAADIYSLGATLYHLLTGRAPFLGHDLGETLSRITAGQFERPREHRPSVPLPLEAICLKAMALRPGDRYGSVRELTAEIDNWLADEPVRAYAEPWSDRARRWVRKHPGPVTGLAVAVVLGLLGAGTLAFLNGKHAHELSGKNRTITQQRDDLEDANSRLADEKATAEAATDFLVKSFRKADPDQDGRKLTVYEVLVRARNELDENSNIDPLQKAAMHDALGESFLGLGLYDESIAATGRALAIRRDRQGADDPNTLNSLGNLAAGYRSAGKVELALPLFEETLRLMKAKLGGDHPDTLISMGNLAEGYRSAGRLDLAMPLMEETLRLMKAKLGVDHPDTLISIGNLAAGYRSAGKVDLAMPLFEETLRLMKAKLGVDHPDTLISMGNLALGYESAGKLDLALPLYEETLRLMKAKLGDDHPETLGSMNNLAAAYKSAGKLDLALQLLEETLRLKKAKLGDDHPDTLTSMNNLAVGYRSAGKLELALPLLEETLRLTKAKLGEDHPHTLGSMNNLARGYQSMGKLDLALPLFEETLRLRKAILGDDHPDTLTSMGNLAVAYLDAKQDAKASRLFGEYLALQRTKKGPNDSAFATTLAAVSERLLAAGQFTNAGPYLRECLKIRRTTQPDEWTTFYTQSMLGASLLGQHKYAEAEPLLLAGYEGMWQRADRIPADAPRLTQSLQRLIDLYTAWDKPDEAARWRAKLNELNAASGQSDVEVELSAPSECEGVRVP